MIYKNTRINISDNSGAHIAKCIHIYNKKKFGLIGDMILVSIKTYNPSKKIKKGELHLALIIRVKTIMFYNNIYFKFSDNAAILLNKKHVPLGSRLFGPSTKIIRKINRKVFLMLPYII
jgi:large subunit ribosomal protein L14